MTTTFDTLALQLLVNMNSRVPPSQGLDLEDAATVLRLIEDWQYADGAIDQESADAFSTVIEYHLNGDQRLLWQQFKKDHGRESYL